MNIALGSSAAGSATMFVIAQALPSTPEGHLWIQLFQTLGTTGAILAVMTYALWKAGRWIGVNVIKPLADRHIKFLDEITTSIKEMAATSTNMAKQVGQLHEKLVIEAQSVIIAPTAKDKDAPHPGG